MTRGAFAFSDGFEKHNRYIQEVFPKLYYLDSQRNMGKMQETLLSFEEDELLGQMRADCCLFDGGKKCSHCFSCIGLLNQKTPAELNAFETEKLLEYKLYQMNLDDFSRKVNQTFQKNGGKRRGNPLSGALQYRKNCSRWRQICTRKTERERFRWIFGKRDEEHLHAVPAGGIHGG